jgi:hypothetical protein
MSTDVTLPPGRLVQGSVWKGNSKDAKGNPLVWKTGADAGKPRQDYFMAIAIPKGAESHWNQTVWGSLIWNGVCALYPNAANLGPNFAWKIEDGDSRVPNKKGKKPCEQEGFARCWVARLSGAFAPQVGTLRGGVWTPVTDAGGPPKRGDYVQVSIEVDFNKSTESPGVFLNHRGVKFHAAGEEIKGGEFDAHAAGFIESQEGPTAPAGFSAPPPDLNPGFAAPPPDLNPGFAAPPPVTPHTAFVANAAVPPPPPARVVPQGPPMTALAVSQGLTYSALLAAGWTPMQMFQNGYTAQP